MKPISLFLGESKNFGDFGLVLGAGDVTLSDGSVRRLYAAGDVDLSNMKVRRMAAAGDVCLVDVEAGRLNLVGDVTCKGHCQAERAAIIGDFEVEFLACRRLIGKNADKVILENQKRGHQRKFTWSGYFEAEYMEIHQEIGWEFECAVKNMLLCARLDVAKEIACENFYGLAPLRAPEIHAETLFLLAQEGVIVGEAAGGTVRIEGRFAPDRAFKKAFPKASRGYCSGRGLARVERVEGDQIYISQTRAGLVSGRQVEIGPMAVCGRVEYTESLQISEKAVVGEAVRV